MSVPRRGESDGEVYSVTLVLVERDRAAIAELADACSEPGGARYGQHLSRSELRELIVLPERDIAAIRSWASEHRIEVIGIDGPFMRLRASTEQVRSAFGRDLEAWLRRERNARGRRAELALPRHIAGCVLKVSGLPGEHGQGEARVVSMHDAEAGQAGAVWSLLDSASSDPPRPGDGGVTPADVRGFYNFDEKLDGSGEAIALLALGGEVEMGDLERFWSLHGIKPPAVEIVDVGRSSSSVTTSPFQSLELTAIVQWAGALAPGARLVVYRIDPMVMVDPWSAFLYEVIGDQARAPTVAAITWVAPERQYYRLHGNRIIGGLLDQAAALGVTVVAASGDWGAFDGTPSAIRDGHFVCDAPWPHAIFPAVEERVLGIGGTAITCREPFTEIGWSGAPPPGLRAAMRFDLVASSGGFSEEIPIPDWQRPALRGYYSRGAGAPGVVPFGRGFPDVAVMASGPTVQRGPAAELSSQGYQMLMNGRWLDWGGGTSIGAPVWAAIIACLNQARLSAGRSRLGFANPLMYGLRRAEPAPFREIIHGNSDVALRAVDLHGHASTYHLAGFECGRGWNPVTGLGVPNVANLAALLTSG